MLQRFLVTTLAALTLAASPAARAQGDEDSFADRLGQAAELRLSLDPPSTGAQGALQKEFVAWLRSLSNHPKMSDRWEDLLELWNRHSGDTHGHGPSNPVPEPAAGLLMLAGMALVALRRRR